jgi:hypothetical protein
MVYGMDFCANDSVYEELKESVSDGIRNIPNIQWVDTKELGRAKKIDPFGITTLRVRPMWTITHPIRVFDYIYTPYKNKDFSLMVLINDDKIKQFDNFEKLVDISKSLSSLEIKDVKIMNPNNPEELKCAKLITYSK